MRLALTGKTGFLGGILYQELKNNNEVITIGRKKSDIIYDFRTESLDLPKVDVFVHCAGMAHILSPKEVDINTFFEVNANYTYNLLKSIELSKVPPNTFVFISSVSVYGAIEGECIDETHDLRCQDPYGLSKLEAERITIKWCKENNVNCVILRLPLVVGNNAPGNIRTLVEALKKGRFFKIGNGTAKKSMVLATDVAKLLPHLKDKEGIFNLTDGYHPSISEFSNYLAKSLGKSEPYSIPLVFAKIASCVGDIIGDRFPLNSSKLQKISHTLTFDDTKARKELLWESKPILECKDLNFNY
ncbi:NAD-dependent epimerase/dehydratase family protein [Sediminibacterium sp. KACHI17]|uniref:NAD-dependent epimerase/dehydratase family protein n=1 Tax=Sediminibacterium sp. KACHI17 TaxID=1751071 RepID=A0AAT9GI98_9BACT